jgi:phosphoglycerate dehydrogenase-like enzyme
MKVLICDPISPKGIALLEQRPELKVTVLEKRLAEEELLPLIQDTVAMVVRSETKVTRKLIEAATKLRVVGRAGVGVDNVDVPAATLRGIVVMNAPGGNTISRAGPLGPSGVSDHSFWNAREWSTRGSFSAALFALRKNPVHSLAGTSP